MDMLNLPNMIENVVQLMFSVTSATSAPVRLLAQLTYHQVMCLQQLIAARIPVVYAFLIRFMTMFGPYE